MQSLLPSDMLGVKVPKIGPARGAIRRLIIKTSQNLAKSRCELEVSVRPSVSVAQSTQIVLDVLEYLAFQSGSPVNDTQSWDNSVIKVRVFLKSNKKEVHTSASLQLCDSSRTITDRPGHAQCTFELEVEGGQSKRNTDHPRDVELAQMAV